MVKAITAEETKRAYELTRKGLSHKEVGEALSRPIGTINGMISATNAGYLTPREYNNALARARGFQSFVDYVHFRRLERSHKYSEDSLPERPTKKEELGRVVEKSTLANLVNEDSPGGKKHQLREAVIVALEKLKRKNIRDYDVILRSIFYEESLKDIGFVYGISHSRVGQMRDRGLEFLARQLSSRKMGEFGDNSFVP